MVEWRRVKVIPTLDGEKCTGCNWEATAKYGFEGDRPSKMLCGSCFAAFLAENEARVLFGVMRFKIKVTKTTPSLCHFFFVFDEKGRDVTKEIANMLHVPYYEDIGLRARRTGMTADAWLRNRLFIEAGINAEVEVIKKDKNKG